MRAARRALVCVILLASCTAVDRARVRDEGGEESRAGEQTAAVFFGGSDDFGDRDGLTYGVDYARRVGDSWGVAGFAELVTGLDRVFAAGALGFLNPIGGVMLYAGPGIERNDGEWGPIGRFGVAYELEIGGGFFLEPGVFYDLSEYDDMLVYGWSTGVKW